MIADTGVNTIRIRSFLSCISYNVVYKLLVFIVIQLGLFITSDNWYNSYRDLIFLLGVLESLWALKTPQFRSPSIYIFFIKHKIYCIRKMMTIAIRTSYYIFCCRNKEWSDSQLLVF